MKRYLLYILLAGAMGMQAQIVNYSATAIGQGASKDLAPYFIGALNGGRTTSASSALLDLSASVDLDMSRRFSWGAGVEIISGATSSVDYQRYALQGWTTSKSSPSAIWIQQLYGELKYRQVFLRLGQKQQHSFLLDENLSSGDLTRSANARGIPGIEAGFIDFVDVPLTNGWLQINGVIEYGRYVDSDFKEEQFNYYHGQITSDLNYTYKRCYFRTKPTERFVATIGMQTAGQFGGSYRRYANGKLTGSENRGFKIKDVFKMFFPTQGGADGYYEGNTLGSWDVKLQYRLRSGDELSVVFEGPWEDGSGIGRCNGLDGLWGIYYHAAKRQIISGVAFEYLDFHNQSGPIHWATHDRPGTSIDVEATGGDDYYNSEYYGSFSNFGIAQATPFLVAPLYNLNGSPKFMHNRARGFHTAISGWLSSEISYTVKYSYQQAWGQGRVPSTHCLIDNSASFAANWDAKRLLDGLSVSAQVAFDAGKLRGDNFGGILSVTYCGNFSLSRH